MPELTQDQTNKIVEICEHYQDVLARISTATKDRLVRAGLSERAAIELVNRERMGTANERKARGIRC